MDRIEAVTQYPSDVAYNSRSADEDETYQQMQHLRNE